MGEQEELLGERIVKLVSKEDIKLGELISYFQELIESFSLNFFTYTNSAMFQDFFPRNFRLALFAFSGHFPLQHSYIWSLVESADALEKFMLHEILKDKRAESFYWECRICNLEARLIEEKRKKQISDEQIEEDINAIIAQIAPNTSWKLLSEPISFTLSLPGKEYSLREAQTLQIEALMRYNFLRSRCSHGFEPTLLLPLPAELPLDLADLHSFSPVGDCALLRPMDQIEMRQKMGAALCALTEPEEEVSSKDVSKLPRRARRRGRNRCALSAV